MENEYFKSERLLYRPYQMEDLKNMVKHRNEKSMRQWFYFQEPECLTEQFSLNKIKECQSVWSKKVNILEDNCFLSIIIKEIGELIGEVGISKRFRPEVHLDGFEIGYTISEAYQGKGYATEATKAILTWASQRFYELNTYPKIELHIEHENWPSRRVAEKTGFIIDRVEQYVTVYSKQIT